MRAWKNSFLVCIEKKAIQWFGQKNIKKNTTEHMVKNTMQNIKKNIKNDDGDIMRFTKKKKTNAADDTMKNMKSN